MDTFLTIMQTIMSLTVPINIPFILIGFLSYGYFIRRRTLKKFKAKQETDILSRVKALLPKETIRWQSQSENTTQEISQQ